VQKSEVRTEKLEHIGLSGVPPDCPVPQEDKGLQRSTTPNPNGQLTWHAPDSEQYSVRCTTGLSGVPIDSKLSQRLESVKRPDPLGLKCDTITSPRRLVTTFITSNSYRV
jgi:hypothetical protein